MSAKARWPRWIFLLFVILASVLIQQAPAAVDSSPIIAGPITNPANGSVYYLLAQNTWKGSQAEAAILGGDLVSIKDAAENQWVFDTFSGYGGQNRALWIGLTDAAQTGTFKWVDGKPVTYLNWAPSEPNEIGREHFVYMFGKDRPDPIAQPPGRWNNFQDLPAERLRAIPICGVVKLRPLRSSISVSGTLSGIGTGEIILVLGILAFLVAVFAGVILLIFQYAKRQSKAR